MLQIKSPLQNLLVNRGLRLLLCFQIVKVIQLMIALNMDNIKYFKTFLLCLLIRLMAQNIESKILKAYLLANVTNQVQPFVK